MVASLTPGAAKIRPRHAHRAVSNYRQADDCPLVAGVIRRKKHRAKQPIHPLDAPTMAFTKPRRAREFTQGLATSANFGFAGVLKRRREIRVGGQGVSRLLMTYLVL